MEHEEPFALTVGEAVEISGQLYKLGYATANEVLLDLARRLEEAVGRVLVTTVETRR